MDGVLAEIGRLRIVPVATIRDSEQAGPLADALVEGHLPCIEVTFRTDAAESCIRSLARRGDLLVGAGTVLTIQQAESAVDAGAKFVVSPGLNPKIVGFCLDRGVAVTPGVCTPSDVSTALEMGLAVVKFFPADAFGGSKTLKAIAAPFPMMRFIPTGGISSKNLLEYLSLPAVLACGGSWMVSSDLLSARRFDEITRLAAEAVGLAANAPLREGPG